MNALDAPIKHLGNWYQDYFDSFLNDVFTVTFMVKKLNLNHQDISRGKSPV
jgi:hypothetical protein